MKTKHKITRSWTAGVLSMMAVFLMHSLGATAQISISPSSTIRWSAYETSAKFVTISSTSGAWRKDTCSLGPHFSMSPTLGPSGELAWFTPSGINETLADIEDAVFIETQYGQGSAQITLIHEHDPYLIKPGSDSLVWTADETGWRSVSVTSAISWTTRIAGGGFTLETESGTGSGTVRARPTDANPSTSDIVAWLEFSAPGARTRSVKLIQRGRSTPMVIPNTFTGTPGMQIPVSRSVTPTGAVTYSVPVFTDPSAKLAPGISLVYSSQSGNGVAGYGWHVSGLSSITLIPKTRYYHGKNKAADVNGSDPAYALDGVPLVDSEEYAAGTTGYPLKTVRGHIRVKKTLSGFEALYPDGRKAVFGEGPATGGNTRLVYPVTSMEDALGNVVTFSYLTDHGTCYPETIAYNTDLACPDTIRFCYVARSDYVPAYSAGVEVSVRNLLKSITSSVNGEPVRTYTLTHGTQYGVSCLLKLGCSTEGGSGEVHLEPVLFGYGDGAAMPAMTFDTTAFRASVVSPYGDTDEESGYCTSRGKFLADRFQDGVIVVPKKANYILTNSYQGHYQYGSALDVDDDNMTLVPSTGRTPLSITVGNGFQDAQGLDCDGDGIDEVVRVLMVAERTQAKTRLTVSSYKYSPSGTLSLIRSASSYVDGYFRDWIFDNPQRRCYRYGTLTQDGHAQLITTGLCNDGFGHTMNSKTAVIDLVSGALLAEESLFQIDYVSEKYHFVTDLDGDGISEVCYITSGGTDVYGFRDNGSFGLLKSYPGLKRSDLQNGFCLADINGDGNLDFVCTSHLDDAWDVFCFTGNAFVKKKYVFGKTDYSTKILFTDLDHDGLQDMVRVNWNGSVTYRLNRGGSFAVEERTAPFRVPYKSEVLQGNVLNFRGSTGLVLVNNSQMEGYGFAGDMRSLRLCTDMRDSFHNSYKDRYADISEAGSVFTNPGGDAPSGDGWSERSIPLQVVSESRLCSGAAVVDSTSRTYRNAVMSTEGAGFTCFGSVTETSPLSSKTVETRYSAKALGAPSSVDASVRVMGTAVQTLDQTNTFAADTNARGRAVDIRLNESVSVDCLTGIRAETGYVYDEYGHPTQVTSSHRIGTGEAKTETRKLTYTHGITDGLYLLGTVASEERTHGTVVTKTTCTLDSLMRPSRIMEYSGLAGILLHPLLLLSSDRYITYDAKGNITTDRSAACGATTYNETAYVYDAAGRYLINSTDPLGRTTSYNYYNKYGKPAQTTDWLGRSVSYVYDAWGNATQKTNPDGTVETTSVAWSSQGEPGLYCVTKAVTGQPDTKIWYDALGREVRNANRRFDGGWQYVTTEYDGRGRLYRTSLPYKDTATGPTQWNTCAYDAYDRPVSLTEATGRQTTWSYSGTSTTTTKEGMQSTSTTDAEGNVVSVVDGGGTITYTLRDDGRPSAVTVTPQGTNQNIVTTFQYDLFGRRTSMVDPSAGTRNDTYTDNADGSSSVAHTGPNGTVTTYYDRYGRVTGVTRPEFNTAYTYGTTLNSSSYGKLISESSTNGTGRDLTYDALGRTATETEYADSTNWLRKTYAYNSTGANLGSLASITYTTHDGDITTESFSYANGHNTGIAASGPGSTTINVFTLTSENALGQPTAVTTGTVSRNYTYTSVGLPTRRRILDGQNVAIQDFEYCYDASTGNMEWRKDNMLGMTESFYYDALNRLTAATQTLPAPVGDTDLRPYKRGTISVSYDSKGNILQLSNMEMWYASPEDPYLNTHAFVDWPESDEDRLAWMGAGMTSFDRPSDISMGSGQDVVPEEGEPDEAEVVMYATYEYNASGEKTRGTMDELGLSRIYLGGGRYERDSTVENGTAQRLFLGGSAYDAPMVLVKEGNGAWTPYNIGRDVQGSITHVATQGGTLLETYYYDPWGNVVPMDEDYNEVDTLAVPTTGGMSFCSKIVGSHGYTGHESIAGIGMYNANARLYDPVTGRFLSPDPLIQDPESTQNFNRYSYCLNNPLKYTDESGEVVGTILTAVIRGIGTIFSSSYEAIKGRIEDGWDGAKRGFADEWREYGRRVENAAKIDYGLLRTDKHRTIAGRIWTVVSRLTWELPQTLVGNLSGHFRNNFWKVNVDYYQDATLINRDDSSHLCWGFTLGSFVNGKNLVADPKICDTFAHEYGHVKQSNIMGLLYIPLIGVPSAIGCIFDGKWGHEHDNEWYEALANRMANDYYIDIGDTAASNNLQRRHKLVSSKTDWFDSVTLLYYALFCFVI